MRAVNDSINKLLLCISSAGTTVVSEQLILSLAGKLLISFRDKLTTKSKHSIFTV